MRKDRHAGAGHSPKCPRCDYDLRATVAQWSDACPLNGRCSECGLVFEWADLLSTRLRLPEWCVESAERAWQFPAKAIGTWGRSLWPWGFWQALRMVHPPRPRRLVVFLFLMLLVMYVGLAVSHGLASMHEVAMRRVLFMGQSGSPQIADGVYAALLPFAPMSFGGTAAGVPISPLEVFIEYWLGPAAILGYMFVALSLCAGTFVVLPASRKKAKVRWAHIFRVLFYSFGLLIVPWMCGTLGYGLMQLGASLLADALIAVGIVTGVALPLMAFIWWSLATSRYLKMSHAWPVGLAVAIIGFLTPLSLFVFINMYLLN